MKPKNDSILASRNYTPRVSHTNCFQYLNLQRFSYMYMEFNKEPHTQHTHMLFQWWPVGSWRGHAATTHGIRIDTATWRRAAAPARWTRWPWPLARRRPFADRRGRRASCGWAAGGHCTWWSTVGPQGEYITTTAWSQYSNKVYVQLDVFFTCIACAAPHRSVAAWPRHTNALWGSCKNMGACVSNASASCSCWSKWAASRSVSSS